MERPDYSALEEILEDMNREGGFYASILARDDGLLIASATAPNINKNVIAAMSGYVASTVERMREELSLGELNDINVRCTAGKAVFKKLDLAHQDDLVLAAVMPRTVRYHLRPLGKGGTRIKNVLGKGR
ncbi:MAG: hypothetical protein R6V83_04405 [Candidatus Thorarchaeota archaeon]